MNTNNLHTPASETKQPWVTPKIEELKPDVIKQQDEEILYYLLNNEDAFRLVTGTTSDYRLKEDPRDFDALGVVNAISTYDFAWKQTGEREYGVMAHELQVVLPYVVTGHKDQVDENGQPVAQRVNYAKLVPVLLKALQQQQIQIEALQQQVSELAGVTAAH
jgi:hypothetical protein